MTRTKTLVLSIIAALSLEALIAASSLAVSVPPEVGRCVAVPPGSGEYEVASCTGGIKAGGSFNWAPGAIKNKFVAGGGETIFETVTAEKIKCKSILEQGEYVGATSERLTFRLFGCEIVALGGKCQNAGPEEIVSGLAEGDYGFITGGEKPLVGVDLSIGEGTEEPKLEFNCDTPGSGLVHVVIFGSAIARMTPLEKMSPTFKKKFSETGGKQKPSHFAGGPVESLTLIIGAKPPQPGALLNSKPMTQNNEESLEIKGLV
ncbi:MAG TPA: hypothetical protein VNZ01_00805 [Solirubrobacteraceae bacterium]|jgi:hypothetical protein|nr:hypothetical protein [Solirubrobacteraceae bacterium]